MKTFAQKQTQAQQESSINLTRSNAVVATASHAENSILHRRRTIGNQAVTREPGAEPERLGSMSGVKGTTHFANDFSRIPLHAPASITIQPKLAINTPGDIYEQEADHVAERVMRMAEPGLQRACACGGGCARCETEQPSQEHQYLQTKHVGSSDSGQIAAPPIVHEVLASPGQPLDTATRAFMEPRFGHDFSRIRIHTDAPAARAAAALGAEAFTVGQHIAFGRGRFLPGTRQGSRLAAHELTHAIQQAATSMHIAMSPDKDRAAPGRTGVVGAVVGWNTSNQQVRVKREVGSPEGYDDRLQAVAVARLAKAEPAAAVKDKNEKWHAVEITADLEGGPDRSAPGAMEASASESSPFVGVFGLPSLARLEQSRQRVDELKARLVSLDDLEQHWKNDPDYRKAVQGGQPPIDLKTFEDEKEKTTKELTRANQTRAALTFGVDESEIKLNRSSFDRESGKINLTPNLAKRTGAAGRHGPEAHQTEDFEPGVKTAFEIDFDRLEKPAEAQATMFHEVSHLKDFEFAQQWVRNYETETKRTFVRGPGLKFFKEWIDAEAAKKRARISKADAELIVDLAANVGTSTEARANVHTFLTALQMGEADVATKELANYAAAMKPGPGQTYGNPLRGSEVEASLKRELQTAYRQMAKPMQNQFDAAVEAAKKRNPDAWVSNLNFKK